MHKLTRLSYNSADWRHPTSEAGEVETEGTYNQQNSFGHEDWLFRSEWQIDGWRYAFLQGVNKSHARLLEEGKPFDVTLFTIKPDKTRRFVATIRDVECLNEQQASEALAAFKELGWYDLMLAEIQNVGGNPSALGASPWAPNILNIRYRAEHTWRYPDSEPSVGNWINHYSRYSLYDFDGIEPELAEKLLRQRSAATTLPNTGSYLRRGTSTTECTPEHARMQTILFEQLKSENPQATVLLEQDYIDISVRTAEEIHLYEIKSDLAPRTVIRLALGQLLEYAYHPSRKHELPLRLFIVGRSQLTDEDRAYLNYLKESFKLPIEYRVTTI